MLRRLLLAFVAALTIGAGLWSSGSVAAHAELLEITPADGAVVDAAPAAVVLRFSEPVSISGGSARVLDPGGVAVSGTAVVDGSTLTIPLGGTLADGTYTVTWVAISEDSHPVSGATTFAVGAPTPGGGAVVDPGLPSAGWGVRVAAWAFVALSYAGALLAAGLWVFLVVVAPAAPTGASWRGRARGVAGRAAVVGAVCSLAAMPLRIARLGGGLGALRDNDLLGAAFRGPIGISTGVTTAALLVLAGLVEPSGAESRRGRAVAGLVVAAVALAGFAIEGHTRSQQPVAVMLGFDVLHLAAGAVWIGGIAALVLAFRSGDPVDELGPLVRRFSTLAVGAVLAVSAAGVVMAWIVLPSPGDLFATGYGQTLLVKVVLVAAVAALGGWNRRTLAGGRPVPPRLGRIVSIELLGLLLVVAVTAVLVNRSPVEASATPTGPTVTVPAPDAVEVPLSSGAGTARYVLSPARTGQNQIELTLTDASGAPIEPVEVPTVDLTEPTLGVGPLRPIVHPIQPGLFHVIADIPIAGTYDMEIRVRTDEFTSVQATSQVVIAG